MTNPASKDPPAREPNDEQREHARDLCRSIGRLPDDLQDVAPMARLIAARDAQLLDEALRPFEELAAGWENYVAGADTASVQAFREGTDTYCNALTQAANELRAAIEQARKATGAGGGEAKP